MFYYLEGPVTHIEPHLAVVDCGGVGYAVNTSDHSLADLHKNQPARMYTYLSVREDALEIYGFSTEQELGTFKLLIGVSGVGPKAAISILSAYTSDQLVNAVVLGDEKLLTSISGIGKKIAQRIILELKDKLVKDTGMTGTISLPSSSIRPTKATEAYAALQNLGFSSAEINKALNGLPVEEMKLEEIIRMALKSMK